MFDAFFPLFLGDWYKSSPWGPQRKYILFLFFILCAHRSTKLHAWWDRSPVHVCSSISQWGFVLFKERLYRGEWKLQLYFDFILWPQDLCASLKYIIHNFPGPGKEKEGQRGGASGPRFWALVLQARRDPGQVYNHRETLNCESLTTKRFCFYYCTVANGAQSFVH